MSATNRLTYDDDLFLRSARVLGIPVVNQTVWRFPEPIDPERVDELAATMATGRLGRLVARSRVPGARDRWVRAPRAEPAFHEPEPIDPADLLGWAHAQADIDLDPEFGPAWRLSAARTTDGGSVLSLVISHVVGDGGVQLGAVLDAVRGEDNGRLPVDDPDALRVRLRDDVADAAGQLRRAAGGVAAAIAARGTGTLPPGTQQASVRDGGLGDPGDAPFRPPFVVVDCAGSDWDRVVAEHEGSSNALFVALGAEILLSTGRVRADAPIRVSIPVATRGENDLRSNTTTGVSIAVEADADGRVSDLREVRRRSKEAFGRIGTAPSPAKALEPLAQLLPDPVVARMARSSPVPLCLCSNLGTVPDDYAAPLGVPASSVVLRSVTRGVTRSMLRARGGGVSLWLTRTGDTVALAVLGLDPDHFPDDDTLRTHVRKVLDARGITTTMW